MTTFISSKAEKNKEWTNSKSHKKGYEKQQSKKTDLPKKLILDPLL